MTAPLSAGVDRSSSVDATQEAAPAYLRESGLTLVASAEPAVVFASLAALAVSSVCDTCVIDVEENDQAAYRICYPPVPPPGRSDHHRVGAGLSPTATLELTFTDLGQRLLDISEHGAAWRSFRGVGVFSWTGRTPTPADHLVATMWIEQAVRTVAWQRSEHAARVAAARARHLDTALLTSRQIGAAIGVLMAVHKITDEHAFDLLRRASQHSHRKLRTIALDVLETGWLDPTLVGGSTGHLAPARIPPPPILHRPNTSVSDHHHPQAINGEGHWQRTPDRPDPEGDRP